MIKGPRYASLYQINTRVWLTELSRALGKPATLDDIRDAELDRIAEMGFDWVWFLSVWQTGPAAQAISRANPEWRREFAETLPDLNDEDIAGSGFAIRNCTVHRDQCHVRLPFADLADSQWRLKDLHGDATYDWAGNDLQGRGLYLDERPWSARVFALTKV